MAYNIYADGLTFYRYTDILLSLLDFLKTLWQEAGQYANMLEPFKASKVLWQQFSNIISQASKLKDLTAGSLGKEEISKLSVKYQCHSSVLEIMACNMFLNKKLLFAESLKKPCVKPKEKTINAVSPPKLIWAADSDPKDIFSKWCDVSVLDGLIQSVSSLDGESEINFQAKARISLTWSSYFHQDFCVRAFVPHPSSVWCVCFTYKARTVECHHTFHLLVRCSIFQK